MFKNLCFRKLFSNCVRNLNNKAVILFSNAFKSSELCKLGDELFQIQMANDRYLKIYLSNCDRRVVVITKYHLIMAINVFSVHKYLHKARKSSLDSYVCYTTIFSSLYFIFSTTLSILIPIYRWDNKGTSFLFFCLVSKESD